ncbi:MAG: nucleotidyltransferase domain-containing protein, partial [Actinomycetota bacterium]|nr:nucleotidyltransferase domain-containing protein [Actinomycetota bacterium]
DGDVLAVLGGADASFTGREVHRLVGHSSEEGVRRTLNRLVAHGVVLRREAGRAHLYRLNREHLAAPAVEVLASLRLRLLDRLREAIGGWSIPPLAAAVFGSVARGEAGPASDLDVLVVRPANLEPDDPVWEDQLFALGRSATAWTGNVTRLLELGQDELPDAGRVLRDALAEGLFVAGSAHEVKRLTARA